MMCFRIFMPNGDMDEIINSLTNEEEEILYIAGKMNLSQNKNFREETITKKLSRRYRNISVKNVLKNLRRKGLVRKYRNKNWCMTPDGLIVAHHITQQRRSRIYNGIRLVNRP